MFSYRSLLPIMLSCSVLACSTLSHQASYEIAVVTDIGNYGRLEEAGVCENDIDWYDENLLDDLRCTQAFAAQELVHYLDQLYGHEAEVFYSSPGDAINARILISISTDPQNQLLQPQGYQIQSSTHEGRTRINIHGADREGALYGAYGLLRHLGVHWYTPEPDGEVLPAAAPSLYGITIDSVENPGFITRGFWARDDRGDEALFNWMARNRINLWSYAQPQRAALRKRGIRFLTGGHQIQQRFLPVDKAYPYQLQHHHVSSDFIIEPYEASADFQGDVDGDGLISYREAHPEWFGMVDGERNFNQSFKYGTNFCTSNQDAVRELSKNFIRDLIDGDYSQADMINFWPLDVGKWCECDHCQAIGSPTDRMLLLLHQVRGAIDKVQKAGRLNRDIILTAPAYLETRSAPTRAMPAGFDYNRNIMTFFPIERCYAHAFNDEQCTDINHYHFNDMSDWLLKEDRHYEGTLFLGEYYNISLLASLPIIYTSVMRQDIPFYYRSGIRHMHYMHVEARNWGTMMLTNYLFASLLWNPRQNVDALLNQLYVEYYGELAEPLIREFYQALERAMSSMKTIRWAGRSLQQSYSLDERLKNNEKSLFLSPHLQYRSTQSEFNDGRDIEDMVRDIQQARQLLDQITSLELSHKVRSRLFWLEKRFTYGESMVHFYDALIRTHMAHHAGQYQRAQAAFYQCRLHAEKLKQMTDVIGVVVGTLKSGDGFTATFNTETYQRYYMLYGKDGR